MLHSSLLYTFKSSVLNTNGNVEIVKYNYLYGHLLSFRLVVLLILADKPKEGQRYFNNRAASLKMCSWTRKHYEEMILHVFK